MAERRSRHSQGSCRETKCREHPTIPEEEVKLENRKEKALVSKTKDATVEVTVKVKRRRDKSGGSSKTGIAAAENGFRKGSWGDLLTSSKGTLTRKETESDRKAKTDTVTKTSVSGKSAKKGCDHSPLCQKIPISDDLYLETHTHVRKIRSTEDEVKSTTSTHSKRHVADTTSVRHAALIRENEELWEEVERLRKEMDVSKGRSKVVGYLSKATETYRSELDCRPKSRAQTQATQTSTACLASAPKKISGACQTDGPPRPVLVQQPLSSSSTSAHTTGHSHTTDTSQVENLRLEKENEALRREATELLTQVNKARSDYLECYNTMKELYQIAANLKQENNNLNQNQQQQQIYHTKLVQALSENREIKGILDKLMNKKKSDEGIHDDQLIHFRNVIQDVKRTIAQEMEGLKLGPGTTQNPLSLAEKDGNTNGAGQESFLNDTNASEIQHIFGTQPPETNRGLVPEDLSSSTQYLTLAGLSNAESHYRPSPCAEDKFSPRISTPNSSSDISYSLSEAVVGASSFRPIHKAAVTNNINTRPVINDTNSEWKKLEAELARSFNSVRNELSNQSTSSYSSSSSTSPNPLLRK